MVKCSSVSDVGWRPNRVLVSENLPSIQALLDGKFLKSRKICVGSKVAFKKRVSGHSAKFMDTLGKFLGTLESLQTPWKVSGLSQKFPDTLKFLDTLENLLDTMQCF